MSNLIRKTQEAEGLSGEGFVKRYRELSERKNSYLCVGLDPALPSMRDKFVIPRFLIEKHGIKEGVKKFCLEIIKAVAPYTPIIKPNKQYLVNPLSYEDVKEIVTEIKRHQCLALIDAKLTDIGSTNQADLYWIDAMDFDATTFSPFPGYKGGTDVIYEWARRRDKGIFALCRMSNPGAADYQTKKIKGVELYKIMAFDAVEFGATGVVVGCTATSELREIREIVGDDLLILSPGLGPQGGDPLAAFKAGANRHGENLVVVSARSINYAYENTQWPEEKFGEAAAEMAQGKRDMLNKIKEQAIK